MVDSVTSKQAFKALQQSEDAMLIDVRTTAELRFVGEVNLEGCKGAAVHVPLYEYPDMQANKHFINQVQKGVGEGEAEKDLYFLCAAGARSNTAAHIMEEQGYKCYNIHDGFTGALNEQYQRGYVNGWKAEKLPWKQQ